MWERNLDTGKWSEEIDKLPKDYYDGIKQDIQTVRLYSKCLSGSVYMIIDDFENIYNTLDIDKIGYYLSSNYSFSNVPITGPNLQVDSTNYEEFYQRYLREYAFTIKNFFTTTKLINSESDNIFIVDFATTETIIDLNSFNQVRYVDGSRLIEGHKILVKDQITEVTLSANVSAEDYFSTNEIVSNYYLIDSSNTSNTYYFYNSDNGIYTYTNGLFVKDTNLSDYETSYKMSVSVNYGSINNNKQFHLLRLKNNYFPKEGDNVEFSERHNWILRHRLDYNNILDINYYDILYSKSTQIYDRVEAFTYSIPDRLLAVGEFGVIINNQDQIDPNQDFKISNIINSKYKVNLRSISESNDYYWVCGDEGTLLKIYKTNFNIERIELNIYSQLTSITFFDNLNGFVVGKFNQIYYTQDGGVRWIKLTYPEYESFSYNKVRFKDLNNVYICGTTGLFIELTRDGDTWTSYKRKIFKTLSDGDYVLVEDLYDLMILNWNSIPENNFVKNENSINFADNLKFNYKITSSSYITLNLDITSRFFDFSSFANAQFYVSISMSNKDGLIYTDTNFYTNKPPFTLSDFSFYKTPNTQKFSKKIVLPIGDDGNIKGGPISVESRVYTNYFNNTVIPNQFQMTTITYSIDVSNIELVLLPTLDKIIVFDKDNKIYKNNNFIYFEFNREIGEIRTITKPMVTNNSYIYFGADKIYYFDFKDILNFPIIDNNLVIGSLIDGPDIYVNKLVSEDKLYMAGNESLLKMVDFQNISSTDVSTLWDPEFNTRYKSKMLFLDYDIASKLNFFTDQGQYRLPTPVYIDLLDIEISGQYFEFKSKSNQKSWIDYYKDAEKTFEYYTYMDDTKKVEFSTKFTFVNNINDFVINQTDITRNYDDIKKFAPSFTNPKNSEFFEGLEPIITSTSNLSIQPSTLSDFELMIHKNLMIFKKDILDEIEIGDIIRLESDIVDVNLIVNKINIYYKPPGGSFELVTSVPSILPKGSVVERYIYCYHTLNENIINNLISYNKPLSFRFLNKYYSTTDLVDKFEKHPLSIGYKFTLGSAIVEVLPRFNNKTAYYNLSCEIQTSVTTLTMDYIETFSQFGYTPNYSLLNYLNNIDDTIFVSSKKFSILPELYGLPGSITSASNKVSFDNNYNKLYFGSDFKFEWESLLKWTFVDIIFYNLNGDDGFTERLFIVSKYFDEITQSYVIGFHKKFILPDLSVGIDIIDIISRNTLSQISDDLQVLNNIQRSSHSKSLDSIHSFTTLENEVKFRFPTDSYLKTLVSDFDIQQNLSGIVYTDNKYQVALNIINIDKDITYEFNAIIKILSKPPSGGGGGGGFANKVTYVLTLTGVTQTEFKVGDLVFVELGGTLSGSRYVNPQYQGYQTIVNIDGILITTSMDWGVDTLGGDAGKIKFIKRDAFLNFLPIDLYDLGSDKKPKQSVEILPEMVKLENGIYSLINVDTNKYKLKFVDGLFLQEIEDNYSWFLQADTSPAVIGKNDNGLVWYKGAWKCGQWFGGTWISGEWLSGDWYGGIWNSLRVKENISSVDISTVNIDNSLSKWQGGRWFGGTWSAGSWYEGRRYGGDWKNGIWYNGIWNDGNWSGGEFRGGIWVDGYWSGGKFNCDSRLSYWLDGTFESGDFENGLWYTGQFGVENQNLIVSKPRFGTRSLNTRITIWHGGKWLNGEFHSVINVDETTGRPIVSDIHNLTIWKTGIWLNGDFYGGIAYNIDFRGGTWYGGIVEEIQVIGVDQIVDSNDPLFIPTNKIYVNGIFKFNVGDEIYIIDDNRNTFFSPIGNNNLPRKYRINKIDELTTTSQTALYLNFDLSSLNPSVNLTTANQNWINYETGLRVVSHFESSIWKSGLWTNGYFETGTFEGGIWYNGIMEGNMGI